MASFLRLNSTALLRNYLANGSRSVRLISTSPKNRETITAACPAENTTAEVKNKNWVSYGWDFKDEANDRNSMKSTFFFSITLCIVWGTFIWSYLPDTQLRDWAQREGFLTLRQREAAGEELISRDYVPADQIVLPSDDELGDTEIII